MLLADAQVGAEPIVGTAQGRQQTPILSVARQCRKGSPRRNKTGVHSPQGTKGVDRPRPASREADGERLYSCLEVDVSDAGGLEVVWTEDGTDDRLLLSTCFRFGAGQSHQRCPRFCYFAIHLRCNAKRMRLKDGVVGTRCWLPLV